MNHRESKGIPGKKNINFCFIDYTRAFDYVDHSKLWKILKEMGIPDHFTCLLRNLDTDKGFPCGSTGKESAHNARYLDSLPWLGRSPGEGKGYPL